ncbi:DegQ family serine endoprotease [Oceanibacterium hippocampi]|uniref:Periplasmic serine endoprotease DegP n=1 Tax=Oceanibacterium hippocampi TaxID=745714 RepID=A0A1Y5SGT5_9PROT|nr:DegQ family serine endoprotease [Oceanibacterium hippocampi]SLN40468.1 Periplasmic serine endoprotease DegP precursor [Oceanibacterium hippocampi]
MPRHALMLALLAMLASGNVLAASEDRAVPETREQIQLSFAPLVAEVAPAVVNIYTRRVQTRKVSPLFEDPFFRRFFGNMVPGGRERKETQNALGSGVVVRPEGIIVTNNHVIDGADQINVVLSDRREFPATVLVADEKTDLAVLRIDTGGEELPALTLGESDDLEVGDLVLAIGNPFGVGQTVTSGIISALDRSSIGPSDYRNFIQTDAAINPGNSGGALVTMDGKLAGINTAIFSRSGGSVGIGFAIPSDLVQSIVISALQGGKIIRPWLGAAGQPVTADLAAGLGLDRPGGVLVNAIHPKGPAAKAGLRVGDVIVGIDGHPVGDQNALRFRIATHQVGETSTLEVLRQGRRITLTMPLEAAPELPPRDLTELTGRHPLQGASVANLSPAFAAEINVSPMLSGVIVVAVEPQSIARRVRIRPGDILLRVNDVTIDSVETLGKALAEATDGWTIELARRGKTLKLVIPA